MNAKAYYNDNDAFVCGWLRELIADGHIAAGDVDERSIIDIQPDDLRGYTQVHFFAGIGGWSRALRLAQWPDDKPVWTASCPCQPLSSAGQRKGHADKRHLWPAVYRLITECRPPVVFGEQVASKDGLEWLSGIRADLEGIGYACGAADLCAASAGAPHRRQRLFWVADAAGGRPVFVGDRSRVEKADQRQTTAKPGEFYTSCAWSAAETISCNDGKSRRIKPGIQPLTHGVSNRVGALRGAGNAIVPQVAAEFIQAAEEVIAMTRPMRPKRQAQVQEEKR